MKIIALIFLTIFSFSNLFSQEKKIKKAVDALNKNKYEECYKYLNEYSSESPQIPLATYVEFLLHTKKDSPKYDLEEGFKKIQLVSQWIKTNTPEKSWCKSYGLCSENILSQIDSLAISALRIVESNKSDQAYQHFIQTFTNTSINALGIQSFHHWKFELASSLNTVESLSTFIKQFPNAQDIPNARKKLEELEYHTCKTSNDIPLIDAFIKKYPNSERKKEAQQLIFELEYKRCISTNDKNCFLSFEKKYPSSKYSSEIKNKIEGIDFANAKKSSSKEVMEAFIRDYPNSKYLEEAQQLIFELEYKRCISTNDKNCFLSFEKKYPSSKYSSEIKNNIEGIDFANAKKASSKEVLEAFIRDYPNSKYLEEAKKKLDELVNGVVIVSTGQGKTEDEAKQSALRSAIEQTFGAFISSKIEILNDQIVSDQITSLSSGNIKSFEIINSVELPTGGYSTTLKAIISIDKLTSFVQSNGVQVEFKGGLFAMNVKKQLLNEKAEIEIVTNVVGTLHNLLQQSFDYSLDVSEPKSKDGGSDLWEVPMQIKVLPNKNMEWCYNYVKSNLLSISLTHDEITNYEKLNKPVYQLIIKYDSALDTIYFRTNHGFESFDRFKNLWFYTHSFYITNGLMTIRNVGNVTFEEYELYPNRTLSRPGFSPLFTENILEFLNPNLLKPQLIYNYLDQVKLTDFEKISKYEIKQDSIRNKFENGGYSLSKIDGTKFTMSSISSLKFPIVYNEDIESFFSLTELDSLMANYNNSYYMGYNDWRLPTVEEIEAILENIKINNFDNLIMKYLYYFRQQHFHDIQLISSSYILEDDNYDFVKTRKIKVYYVTGPSQILVKRFTNLIESLNNNYAPNNKDSSFLYIDSTNGYSEKTWYGRNFLRGDNIREILVLMVR